MPTLQCLILAQLYCIQRGDYDRLLTYKALAVTLSSRLGLHQSQKRFALGASTCEMRKKVFWSLYTVDWYVFNRKKSLLQLISLPASLLSLWGCQSSSRTKTSTVRSRAMQTRNMSTRPDSRPLALASRPECRARLHCSVLPGYYPEFWKRSTLLVLHMTSPCKSFRHYRKNLMPGITRSRHTCVFPLLMTSRPPELSAVALPYWLVFSCFCIQSFADRKQSLTYHFIRALIHRPAVCASLGPRGSSSMIALAGSSKHIIQIVELLSERALSFSFCLNKDELLVLSGLGLLFQSLDLNDTSKMSKDNQKMTSTVAKILSQTKAPSATEFQQLTPSTSSVPSKAKQHPPLSRHNSDGAIPAPEFLPEGNVPTPEKNRFKAAAQRLMAKNPFERNDQRRATYPNISLHQNAMQTQSQPNIAVAHISTSEPAYSPANPSPAQLPASARPSAPPNLRPARSMPQHQHKQLNLDYLSFSNVPTRAHSPDGHDSSRTTVKQEPSDWERLLGSLDNGQTNIFDNIYGGPPVEFLDDRHQHHHDAKRIAPVASSLPNPPIQWNTTSPPDIWAVTDSDINALGCHMSANVAQPESVFSIGTDDGTATGDEFFGNDWGSASSNNGSEAYAGIVMPNLTPDEHGLLSSMWEATAVL